MIDAETLALYARCDRIEPTTKETLMNYMSHRSEEWVTKRLDKAVEEGTRILVREGNGYTLTPRGYREIDRALKVHRAWAERSRQELKHEVGPQGFED